jgi:Tfp pilus assembly protein PilF
MKLGRWDEAEVACTDAIRARPLNRSVWSARGRFYMSRVRPEQAAQSFATAIRLMPDDIALREQHCLVLSGKGNSNGSKSAVYDMVDRFGTTDDPDRANSVAWTCALLPNAVSNLEGPIRPAEAAVKGASRYHMADSLTTLGATLYRARRLHEAVRRLDEGIQSPRKWKVPQAWAFLAMAHHRLGHRAEARRWLDRLREYQPSTDPNRFWDELEIRMLRSEAEAVVLYDPIFPADAFAH